MRLVYDMKHKYLDRKIYDLRILLPSIILCLFCVLSIFLIEYIRAILCIVLLFVLISLVYVLYIIFREKYGYSFHADRFQGNFAYWIALIFILCFFASVNLMLQYNNFLKISNILNTKSHKYNNNATIVNCSSGCYFLGKILNYPYKANKTIGINVEIMSVGQSAHVLKNIEKFNASLYVNNFNFTSDNNISKNVSNTIKHNLNIQKLENVLIPSSLVVFKAKFKIGDFYKQNNILTLLPSKNNILKSKNMNAINFFINNVFLVKKANCIWKFGQIIRRRIYNAINLNRRYDSLILGMSIGDTKYVDDELKEKMRETSTLHLLSVSGSHLAIVTVFINFLFSFIEKKKRVFLILIVHLFFIILIGPAPPVIRSVSMSVITLSIFISKHNKNSFNVFSFVFMGFLLENPLNSVNISFLLSSFATLGIILFTRIFIKNMALNKSMFMAIGGSFFAQIFTMPIILLFYPKISIISILVNLIITPFVAIITVAGLLIGILPYFISVYLYILASVFAYILGIFIESISSIPYMLVEWGSGVYSSFVFIATIVFVIWVLYLKKLLK